MGLEAFLRRVIRDGDLQVRLPSGKVLRLGDGQCPAVAVGITSRTGLRASPSMALGEAYMDGGLVLDQGGIHDFIEPQ